MESASWRPRGEGRHRGRAQKAVPGGGSGELARFLFLWAPHSAASALSARRALCLGVTKSVR